MPSDRTESACLIVVGGSTGGLTAALATADQGQRAIVLEAAKEIGGSAIGRAEHLAAPGSRFQREGGVADDADRLATDIMAAAHHHSDEALVRAIAAEGAGIVEWLADRHGVAVAFIAAPPAAGHSVARLHAFGPQGGTTLIAALGRAAHHRARIALRPGMVVEQLVRDEHGAVTGVAMKPDRRGQRAMLSGSVLLAAGGYSAHDGLIAELAPSFTGLPHVGTPSATGASLQLGLSAGAQAKRLDLCAVSPLIALPGQLTVSLSLVEAGGILVNQRGQRFRDETSDVVKLAEAVRAQPGRVAYLLFDERIAAAAREPDPYLGRVILPRTGRRNDALADLAKQFEIPADALEATLTTYNANLDLGGDPFGRAASGSPIESPFYGIRVTAGRQATLGGLVVDAHARVLDASGQPIVGLYATGGAIASLAGDDATGGLLGVDTLTAMALGRLAAHDAAARIADHTDHATEPGA